MQFIHALRRRRADGARLRRRRRDAVSRGARRGRRRGPNRGLRRLAPARRRHQHSQPSCRSGAAAALPPHADPRSRLFGLDCRRQPDHVASWSTTTVLIDAGTGVGDLTLDEMARIDHIFVTHSHLDHVLAIGLLADSVTRRRRAAQRPPVQVHALPATHRGAARARLQRRHLARLHAPARRRPPGAAVPCRRGRAGAGTGPAAASRCCRPATPCRRWAYAVLAQHAGNGAWVFTGDTGPNPALWQRLATLPMAALVIETAFRDDEHALADDQPAPVPGAAAERAGRSSTRRPTSTSPTSSRARSMR